MSSKTSLSILLVGLLGASAARAGTAYYSVAAGGSQWQIGDGLPIPIQDQFSNMGGKNGTMPGPIGTYQNFPPLLIPVTKDPAKALVKVTLTMTKQPSVTIPPGLLRRIPTKNGTTMGTPVPRTVCLANNNPRVIAVRTTLSFSAPAKKLTTPMGATAPGTIMFATGQRANQTTTYNGTPVGSMVIYRSKGARFGGAAQTRIKDLGTVTIWADNADHVKATTLPCKHPKFGGVDANCYATKIPAYPGTLAAHGGPVSNKQTTPGNPIASPTKVALSIGPNCAVMSTPLTPQVPGAADNMATSIGFPWTTGAITISQPAAIPSPEKFHITGMDNRVKGWGTLQMVSSSLSKRLVTGPNANRAWAEYTLPEPGAALGAAVALAVLWIGHGVARRRR